MKVLVKYIRKAKTLAKKALIRKKASTKHKKNKNLEGLVLKQTKSNKTFITKEVTNTLLSKITPSKNPFKDKNKGNNIP